MADTQTPDSQPLRVVFAGKTGTGKSALINSLGGREIKRKSEQEFEMTVRYFIDDQQARKLTLHLCIIWSYVANSFITTLLLQLSPTPNFLSTEMASPLKAQPELDDSPANIADNQKIRMSLHELDSDNYIQASPISQTSHSNPQK